MFRPKSNSNVRKAPTELDNEVPIAPVLEFDYVRCTEPGKDAWPTHHSVSYTHLTLPTILRV